MGDADVTPRFRARKVWRIGPYFRNYSASAGEGRARMGFTSHGVRFRLPLIGTVTRNFTTGVTTWNSPGPGSVAFGGRRRSKN